MLRDDLIDALRSVEMPPEVRARVPYGTLADALQPVILDVMSNAAATAVSAYIETYAQARIKQGWSS